MHSSFGQLEVLPFPEPPPAQPDPGPTREGPARMRAMAAVRPRIEAAPWPDDPAFPTWYRLVSVRGRVGRWQLSAPRGSATKVSASAALSAEHGDLPVYAFYGVPLYRPTLPTRPAVTGYEVHALTRDGEWRFLTSPRSLGRARSDAQAYYARHELPVRIYERQRRKRGRLLETIPAAH